jgi:hypothetical protein
MGAAVLAVACDRKWAMDHLPDRVPTIDGNVLTPEATADAGFEGEVMMILRARPAPERAICLCQFDQRRTYGVTRRTSCPDELSHGVA